MRKRILAVASGGGHWEQLMLLKEAFGMQRVVYATTLHGLEERSGLQDVVVIPDCNRHRPWEAIWSLIHLSILLIRVRPHVVISTGALPGVIALALGRLMRARTIWVDSIANAEKFSMAGRKAGHCADLWLSQWPEVAAASGAAYAGSVL